MDKHSDHRRRRFLIAATTIIGGAGLIATSIPFLASLNPSERARSAGAPVKVDISRLEFGQQLAVSWRGKPVWVVHRTPKMLEDLRGLTTSQVLRDPESQVKSQQPEYAGNEFRSMRPEYLVVIGICTHLGCVPTFRPELAPPDLGPDWVGGYLCPCHGSRFDLAGRVFRHVPAPTNLVIPPHRYLSDSQVLIGEDPEPPA